MTDLLDAELDQILTVAVLPFRVILTTLLLENNDLAATRLADDRGRDGGAAHGGRADQRLVAADHQHVAERDLVVLDAAEDVALHEDGLPFSDAVLLSTGTNNGEQRKPPQKTTRCSTGVPSQSTARDTGKPWCEYGLFRPHHAFSQPDGVCRLIVERDHQPVPLAPADEDAVPIGERAVRVGIGGVGRGAGGDAIQGDVLAVLVEYRDVDVDSGTPLLAVRQELEFRDGDLRLEGHQNLAALLRLRCFGHQRDWQRGVVG